ncbi:alkylmercury lyase family protein [Spirillospora sp. NPDC047418]
MDLMVLTVQDCPNGPLLEERLAEVQAERSRLPVTRRVISDEAEAARWGMRGSPTLLIDGIDPFADPSTPASVSCRMYRAPDGRLEGAPPVAALRRALEAADGDPGGAVPPEPWADALGRAGAGRLAPAEGRLRAVHQRVLHAFARTGRAPEVTELAEAAAPRDARTVLEELHAANFLRLDEAGGIRAAYPFSAAPTAHIVQIAGGLQVYAMCAVDALGIAAMLHAQVRIRSADPGTGTPVTVTVPADGSGALWDPVTAVVFAGRRTDQSDCASREESTAQPAAVDVCCGYVNFFASARTAAAWERAHPEVTGRTLGQADTERLGTPSSARY